MDWNNVNLTDAYEREQPFLDSIDFDTILLELKCNFKKEELTEEVISAYIQRRINQHVKLAIEIAKSNLPNIVKQAIKERD